MTVDDPAFIKAKIQRILMDAPEQVGFEYVADRIFQHRIGHDEQARRDLIILARAFVDLLKMPEFLKRLPDFYTCTHENEALQTITRSCFTDYPATRKADPHSDAQNAQTLVSLPLGVQKSYARSHERAHHEALLHTPWPQVVEILCENPSIQQRDIVIMASRRPTQNHLLEPILQSLWSSRPEVRFALAANPSLSVSHAMRCALSLSVSELNLLLDMPELHRFIHSHLHNLINLHESERFQ